MTLTLLIDLDDTLLANSMGAFLPEYLKKLSNSLAEHVNPELTVHALMAGTQRMIRNQVPTCALRDVFDAYFFPAVGIPRDKLQPLIDEFYELVFPSLQSLTQPIPGGVELVDTACRRGYQVAIATAPLFPRTAIVQRLAWAGICLEQQPIRLVPSYEISHFAKPNPAYYAELLALMGWKEGPVIMIGDDYDADIQPAAQLGLATYWVQADNALKPPGSTNPTGRGKLSEFLAWLDQQDLTALEPEYNSPTAMTSILRATPAALQTICSQLDGPAWVTRLQPAEWCPTEILCHLRDVEIEVNQARVRWLLTHPNPFMPGQDTDRWAEERNYICQDGQRALKRFSISRQRTLRMLENMPAEAWNISGRHAIFGPTQLKELVEIMTGHDRLHVRQVLATLSKENQRVTFLN